MVEGEDGGGGGCVLEGEDEWGGGGRVGAWNGILW